MPYIFSFLARRKTRLLESRHQLVLDLADHMGGQLAFVRYQEVAHRLLIAANEALA